MGKPRAPRKPRAKAGDTLPDLLRSQCPADTFRATWAGVDPAEEHRRRALAQQLVEGRLPPDYLRGSSSHGELFDRT
jgi:hypothetical protein